MARLALRNAVVLAAFSLALCARLARAQGPGPGFVLQGEGGLVTVLVLDPSSPSMVFASTARGSTGRRIRERTGSRAIGASRTTRFWLGRGSGVARTLYATTDTGGVYKSPDGGNRWTSANQGLASRYVGVVAAQGRALYAGTEGGRIFRSVDAAATWAELMPPTTRVAVTAIAVDPSRRSFTPAPTARVSSGARTAGRPGPRRGPAQPGDGPGPGHRSDEVLDAVRGDV